MVSKLVSFCLLSTLFAAQHASAQDLPSADIVRIQAGLRQLEGQQEKEAVRAYYDTWRGWADGLAVVGTAGYTDRNAGYAEPGNQYPIDIDGEPLYGLELGFIDKKIARDLCVSRPDCLDRYLTEEDATRWALLDALRLDLRVGYGKRLDGSGTNHGSFYFAGLKWVLPLTGPERNPLDE